MQERVASPKPDPAPQHVTFDAIMPAAMAARAEESGVKKAAMDPLTVLILSVLAGAFVAFGAIFATTVSAGSILVTAADGAPAASAALLSRRGQGWPLRFACGRSRCFQATP